MTIKEKLSAKNKELAEKRDNLKKVVDESSKIAADDKATSKQLKEARDKVTAANEEVRTLQEDVESIQSIIDANESINSAKQENKQTENRSNEKEDEKRKIDKKNVEVRNGVKVYKEAPKGTKIESAEQKRSKLDENKEVRAFGAYVKSFGFEHRDGFKTTNGQAVIPSQILNLYQIPENPNDLAQYVNKFKVSAPAGKLPVSPRLNDVMVTIEELKNNDERSLAINEVDYSLKTFRQAIPVSEEMFDDAAIDINGFVAERAQRIRNNTEQVNIASLLKTAGAVSIDLTDAATSVADSLKDVYNTDIPVGYNKAIVATQSAYNILDKLKDSNGRYLLQDNIATATGKQFLGSPLILVDDWLLQDVDSSNKPVAGTNMRLFVGDLRAFVLEPYKVDMTAKWIDYDVYGQKFAVFFRADFVKAVDEAGKFITLTQQAQP